MASTRSRGGCLASLAAHPLDMSYEVIVIDDAYAEPLDLASMQVEGARLVRHQNNLGFLRTQRGGRVCRGRVRLVAEQRHRCSPM